MIINWFGHSCFRIEVPIRGERVEGSQLNESVGAKAISILIDPFSKDVGLRPPKIKDDLVLVTHDHYDHNNISDLNPEAFVIKGPGEYEKNGISVRGILSFHDKSQGKERGLNTMYVIKAEDMTVCHLGDLGQEKLDDSQVQEVGNVDILLVPVGGNYTIDYKEAVGVIRQIEPQVVIPMHYRLKDLRINIEGLDKFVKELGLMPEKVDKYKITKKLLSAEEMKLIVFNF